MKGKIHFYTRTDEEIEEPGMEEDVEAILDAPADEE